VRECVPPDVLIRVVPPVFRSLRQVSLGKPGWEIRKRRFFVSRNFLPETRDKTFRGFDGTKKVTVKVRNSYKTSKDEKGERKNGRQEIGGSNNLHG
jgi:hypothetical protein